MIRVIDVQNYDEARQLTQQLTAGKRVSYGVGNDYPEDFTVIDSGCDRWVWVNQDGQHIGAVHYRWGF